MFSTAYRSFVLAALALAGTTYSARMDVVGNSGVSAQMMFLQSNGQAMILDKTENNPVTVAGHPAWATAYNYNSNTFVPLDVRSNAFCAGGMTLADGRWIVVGGNKAVGPGGVDAKAGAAPYGSYSGGRKLRFMSPCSGSACQWTEPSERLSVERWYATVEPMKDGAVMILGGMRDGGFVPTQGSNEPSYEFYPKVGGPTYMDLLKRTVPLSLYPITYLLSDGRVFVQGNKQVILWNTDSLQETRLPNAPVPVNYPSSGGTALLPLRPSNNYRETILECGGNSLGTAAAWGNEAGPAVMVTQKPASNACNTISPLSANPAWTATDPLAEGRSMGQFIQLPTGELWFGNGVKTGVAGYTTDPNSVGQPSGQSFGDNPSYRPMLYNHDAPAGQRWRSAGQANVGRLYHSSATLLPDSSILVSGSNPRSDVSSRKWKTEYSVERWYPDYFDSPRPANSGLPSSFSYGGNGFSLTMGSDADAANTKVVIVRTGFSTHAMNMGQRMIELRTLASGSTVKVAQLPPNPALFAPGPALAFVVVNGIPSRGKFVIVGSGRIGAQPVAAETQLNKRDDNSTIAERSTNYASSVAKLLEGEPVANGMSKPPGFIAELTDLVEDTLDALADGTLNIPHLSGRGLERHRRNKRHL